jgi:hypothetical protein
MISICFQYFKTKELVLILVVFKKPQRINDFHERRTSKESPVLGWVILILIIFVDSNFFQYFKTKEPIGSSCCCF